MTQRFRSISNSVAEEHVDADKISDSIAIKENDDIMLSMMRELSFSN